MKASRRNRLTLIAILALLAWPALAGAQERRGPISVPPASPAPQETAASPGGKKAQPAPPRTPLVSLDVLATDEDGLVLAGLHRDNFRVLDNGKPQSITHFEGVGAPITVVLLMEYSGMSYSYFAYKAAAWGSAFLNHLEPKDYLALVTYNIKPTVQVDFTRNRAQVQQALGALSYPQSREASLYDAMIDTLDRLDHVKGKKAVLLIGTGANTFGRSNLGETLRRIKRSDATIFVVGVAEAEYRSATGNSIAYLQSKNALQTFAKLTGGMAWFPRFQGEIPGIFRSVAAHLRNQYRIGFTPADLARDGKYHKLKVEIVGPDGRPLVVTNPKGQRRKSVVYTREGYTAPAGNPRE
ncbi:MAG TPA: VWA domain-containing protein [Patescibacteria group bacterium]|nr:VWA domain-containing protein [Patescibacteria group bacterium]